MSDRAWEVCGLAPPRPQTLEELMVVRAFVDDEWHVTDRNWSARASLICRPAREYADAAPAHFFVTGDPARVTGAPHGRLCAVCERLAPLIGAEKPPR